MNYATPASDDVEGAQKFLDEICASSGDRNVTREYCATPADVFVAFQRIFFDLWKYPEKLPADWPKALELPGEFTFSVPMLTSEATVNVFGKGVSSVTLRDPSGKEMVVTGDYERDGFIAVVEDEKYYSVKMICPKDGEWTCYVEGTGDVSVLVNSTDLQEMGLSIVANSQNPGEVLRKNDVIRVDSFFAYQDYQIHNHDIYEQTYKNAKLQVQHSNGTVREYPMNADRQGYYCELMLNEFPGGALTLQVVLEDNMFRNGRKISDAITFKTENLQLELTGNGPESLTSYVNAQFDRIDLGEIFSNPDNDNITYGLECADRSVSFDYTEADGYMTIDAGLTPGDYEVAITAKDPDMNKPLRYTMNLSVQDRVPVVEKIPEVELWVNHFGFQKEKNATQTFDLSQYIYDPDGIAMDYDVVADSLVNVTLEGSSLNFSPVEKGETVISVTASDGVSQVDAQIEVSVISAKKAFWRDNWIKFALAGALLVLLILILIFISKNTRVKGVWNISFVENDGFPIEANKVKISTMNIGRKKVFLLKDLLTAVASRLDGSLSQNLLRYIGEQKAASKIELKGVLFGNGFVVRKIPKDDAVRVVCDGSVKTGKATVRGSAKFEFQATGGVGATDTLVITFKQSRK